MNVDIIGVFGITICFLAAAIYLATKPTKEEQEQLKKIEKMLVSREKPVRLKKKNGMLGKILKRLGL
jgi:hypothetical protein